MGRARILLLTGLLATAASNPREAQSLGGVAISGHESLYTFEWKSHDVVSPLDTLRLRYLRLNGGDTAVGASLRTTIAPYLLRLGGIADQPAARRNFHAAAWQGAYEGGSMVVAFLPAAAVARARSQPILGARIASDVRRVLELGEGCGR